MLGMITLSASSEDSIFGLPVTIIVSLRSIILYIQCFELLLQAFLFRSRFFGHWGYCLDSMIIVSRLGHFLPALYIQMLSYLRVWRFIQVVQTYLKVEVTAHIHTKDELSTQIASTNEWKKKAEIAEGQAQQHSNEELETLREALNLAAIDVAAMKSLTNGGYGALDVDVVAYNNK